MNARSALAETVFALCSAHNARHLAIIDAAKVDPKVKALYDAWLLLTDCSEDAPVHVLNDVITRAEQIVKRGLGL